MVFNLLAAPASGGAALAGRTIGTDFASSLATNEEPPPPSPLQGMALSPAGVPKSNVTRVPCEGTGPASYLVLAFESTRNGLNSNSSRIAWSLAENLWEAWLWECLPLEHLFIWAR